MSLTCEAAAGTVGRICFPSCPRSGSAGSGPAATRRTAPGSAGLDGCCGWCGGLYGIGWRLHEGFNAQLGLSTSFGVGRNRMKGVGFGQSAAFAYALPIGKRWSVAASLYAQNMDWGNYHLRDVGVGAVAAFRATERINLYGYVTHSFVRPDWQRAGCLYSPFMDYVRTRVGAMAEFKIGENTFIGISLEHDRY